MDMRKSVVLGFFLLIGVSGNAQESETRLVSSFSGVRASEAVDVYLKKGEKESAKVETTGLSPSDVVTEVTGSYLKIHLRSGNYRIKKTVKVYVTYVTLDRISASSASNIFSEGVIKSGKMEISASSAASVEVTLDAESVSVDASSAGDVVVEGKTKSVTVEASSAGDVDAYRLDAEDVQVSASSAGSIKVSVTKSLQADASSGGTVRYRGNPMKTVTNSHSGGSVKKSN
jgi:Putative auto-transporter adhesin, head GIN domain